VLDVEIADGVGTVLINRPEKRNAMTAEMWAALPGLLAGLAGDPAVRVVVLTGAGDTFCAGADIGDLARFAGQDKLSVPAEEALAAFPKPTIAMIRGFCVGGGCQLAAACDLRFAAGDARFGITPGKLGIVYPLATTRRLVRLVGPAAAKYLLYSGDLIGAEHALRIGFLDEVLPAAGLAGRVAEFCRTVAARSQLTVQAAKELVDAVAAGQDATELGERWQAEVVRAAVDGDTAEGIAAFLARRPPKFTWSGPTPR
jgi:enoyl-CoA hydratase/carnithine racemase